MKCRLLTLAGPVMFLALSTGCLRSYVVAPISSASLNRSMKSDAGLEMKTKAFIDRSEITDKFGAKLAEDRQVIPVQVLISNKGTQSYRVLRTSFVLTETNGNVKLPSLTSEQIYQLGRHGYGAPVCGMIFGGILGIPSLVTTMNANDRLRDDYSHKLLQDAIVDPDKETNGVVFFDPAASHLSRDGKYKLIVELENTSTNVKEFIEQPLL